MMGFYGGDIYRQVTDKCAADMLSNWHYKRINDLTIEDALQAYSEGFDCICADGKVQVLTNMEEYYV